MLEFDRTGTGLKISGFGLCWISEIELELGSGIEKSSNRLFEFQLLQRDLIAPSSCFTKMFDFLRASSSLELGPRALPTFGHFSYNLSLIFF